MAKKFYVKLILLWGAIAVLSVCSWYLKSIGEQGNAIALFFCIVYLVVKNSRILKKWQQYCELCSELKSVGDDPAHQAVQLGRLKSVNLWVYHAPAKEKARFINRLAEMSESDLGYRELKYIVEQINKKPKT